MFIQIKILNLRTFATCAIFLKSATDYDFNIYQHTAYNMRYPAEERIEIHYKGTGLGRQETRRKIFRLHDRTAGTGSRGVFSIIQS